MAEDVVRNSITGDPTAAVLARDVNGNIYINSQVVGAAEQARKLCVLAVDDEPHVLQHLVEVLEADPRVGRVNRCADGLAAMRFILEAERASEPLHAVFLDLHMPTMDGMELARLLARFAEPPAVVVVTAHPTYAVKAFEYEVVDYLLKPVRQNRMGLAIDKVLKGLPAVRAGITSGRDGIPVKRDGVPMSIRLDEVELATADGDFTRLRTASGDHLLGVSLETLSMTWTVPDFVRISDENLVAVRHVERVREDRGQMVVWVAGDAYTVSSEQLGQVRDLLMRTARPGM